MSLVQRGRAELVVGAYKAGVTLASRTPRPVGATVAQLIGRGAALAATDRRIVVERNLRRVVGDVDERRLRRMVNATFDSYARYYLDSFRLPEMSTRRIDEGIRVVGIEHLEEALAEDEVGPVLALPHLGGWEWAAAWITRVRGWKLAAVVEELSPPELFEWFLDFRRSLGMNIIPLGPHAAAEVAAAVMSGEIMCLLSDRDIGGSGVEVEFFGERTTLPAGPAMMAFRTGCRVLPTAVYFAEDGVEAEVRPPLEVHRTPGGRLRDDVTAVTQALACELESLIARAPEQWHLMQPNWPSDFEALGR